jgi:hypothetical protein
LALTFNLESWSQVLAAVVELAESLAVPEDN